jgi:hypothetical protein
MARNSQSLEELAVEAVRLQLEHRLPPKAQRLLNLLSKDTSSKQPAASTSSAPNAPKTKQPAAQPSYQPSYPLNQAFERAIRDMMRDHPEMTEEEVRRQMEMW